MLKKKNVQTRANQLDMIEMIEAMHHLLKQLSRTPINQTDESLKRMYQSLGRTVLLYAESVNNGKNQAQVAVVEELLEEGLHLIENKQVSDLAEKEWSWIHLVNQSWYRYEFVKKYHIRQPSTMTDDVFQKYLEKLRISEEMLARKEQWDDAAIQAFFNQWHSLANQSDGAERMVKQFDWLNNDVQKVGSQTYTILFNASKSSEQVKIERVLQHLQAKIDDRGLLQLMAQQRLDVEIPPHSFFWESFAKSVRKAYPKGLLPKNNPAIPQDRLKMIHQFRMYIDRQNLGYIRSHYSGASDLEKLLAYGKEHRLSYHSTSRLHNRYSERYPFKGQENDKVTTKNGLSEFIINATTGKFVTQWDVFQEEEGQIGIFREDYHPKSLAGKAIVETESFNYSNQKEAHQLFDVRPAKASNGLEHSFKLDAKKYWKSEEWFFNGGKYDEKYKQPKTYPFFKRNKNR